MNVAVQGLPKPIYANYREENQITQVTTLSNGLRVASENRFGEFCTIGGRNYLNIQDFLANYFHVLFLVIIDSGSRYEVAYPSGISHFMEKLAFNVGFLQAVFSHIFLFNYFQSTKTFPDKDIMMNTLEKHGGICDSQASRDTFIYAASAYTSGLDDVMKMLGEVTLRPNITNEEVDAARQAISFELETLNMRPEQEILLMDMIHGVCYKLQLQHFLLLP